MAEKKANVHSGHRKRVREKFLRDGIDSFEEHQVLEFLLFYAIPYKDTNELAHRLLDRYRSLAGVCEAPIDELMREFGLTETAAVLLKLVPDLSRRYIDSRFSVGTEIELETMGDVMKPKFIGRIEEVVVLALGNARGKLIFLDVVAKGSLNSTDVPIRRIVDIAIRHNAKSAFIAHNHPGGSLLPSGDDLDATRLIANTLASVGVKLIDHFIFADEHYVSLARHDVCSDVLYNYYDVV